MALPAGMTVEAEAPASAIQTILPAVQDTLFVNGLLCSNWMPVRVMLREPISRALALIVWRGGPNGTKAQAERDGQSPFSALV